MIDIANVPFAHVAPLFLLLLLFAGGCSQDSTKDYQVDEVSFEAKHFKMIEEKTGLTLPKGSRGLHLFYRGYAIDPAFVAKVQIPGNAQEALRVRLEEIPQHNYGIEGSSLTQNLDWWTPSKGTIKVERVFDYDMNAIQVILALEEGRWVLYLMWVKV
jgi:hypothetical protein